MKRLATDFRKPTRPLEAASRRLPVLALAGVLAIVQSAPAAATAMHYCRGGGAERLGSCCCARSSSCCDTANTKAADDGAPQGPSDELSGVCCEPREPHGLPSEATSEPTPSKTGADDYLSTPATPAPLHLQVLAPAGAAGAMTRSSPRAPAARPLYILHVALLR